MVLQYSYLYRMIEGAIDGGGRRWGSYRRESSRRSRMKTRTTMESWSSTGLRLPRGTGIEGANHQRSPPARIGTWIVAAGDRGRQHGSASRRDRVVPAWERGRRGSRAPTTKDRLPRGLAHGSSLQGIEGANLGAPRAEIVSCLPGTAAAGDRGRRGSRSPSAGVRVVPARERGRRGSRRLSPGTRPPLVGDCVRLRGSRAGARDRFRLASGSRSRRDHGAELGFSNLDFESTSIVMS